MEFRDFDVEIDFEYEGLEFQVNVTGEWCPGRPAPYSRNPSCPAFSDCGDPAEIEVGEVTILTHEDDPRYTELEKLLEGKDCSQDESDRVQERIEEILLEKLESELND